MSTMTDVRAAYERVGRALAKLAETPEKSQPDDLVFMGDALSSLESRFMLWAYGRKVES
jgi:hypothetical protein